MRGNLAKAVEWTNLQRFRHAPLPRSYTDYLGRQLFLLLLTVQGLAAFAMITLGVILKKSRVAWPVIQPCFFFSKSVIRPERRSRCMYHYECISWQFTIFSRIYQWGRDNYNPCNNDRI